MEVDFGVEVSGAFADEGESCSRTRLPDRRVDGHIGPPDRLAGANAALEDVVPRP